MLQSVACYLLQHTSPTEVEVLQRFKQAPVRAAIAIGGKRLFCRHVQQEAPRFAVLFGLVTATVAWARGSIIFGVIRVQSFMAVVADGHQFKKKFVKYISAGQVMHLCCRFDSAPFALTVRAL